MKTKLTKIICTALSLLLVGGASAGIAVMATQNDGAPESKETSASGSTANVGEKPQKNETVYVLAGADGSVKKIIVSDWIKNVLGDGKLNDASDLSGIENVKGDEGYTMGGGNTKVWDAEGNDIYYRGNIDRELPVSVKISYTLDGKPVSADEIAGKSGNVTVRFDYTNNQYKTVTIDGKEETICVPFAMLTGMLLDNDVFTDITVTGGRLVNDGDRTAVVGVAFPGTAQKSGADRRTAAPPLLCGNPRQSQGLPSCHHGQRCNQRAVQQNRHRCVRGRRRDRGGKADRALRRHDPAPERLLPAL